MGVDYDILSFSDRLDWERDRSRGRQQLLLRWAKESRVLNFNPPLEWRHALRCHVRPRLTQIQEGLWHFEWGSLFPTFYRPQAARAVVGLGRRLTVAYLCRKLNIQSPIYIAWGPHQTDTVLALPRAFTVYYAYDHFESFAVARPEWREHTRQREIAMASISHIAFGVSDGIVEDLRSKGFGTVYYLPNGVDFNRFTFTINPPEPADLAGIPHPRLVYLGGLVEKVDFQILKHIAATRGNWSVVLIGAKKLMSDEQRTHFASLIALPNVYMLGPRPFDATPQYMAHVDVGIVLFREGTDGYYCSPLKVYEYLATGLPVVATPVPEVMKMGDLVYTARASEEWVQQIERALREDNPDLRVKRKQFARENSWDDRAQAFLEIVSKALEGFDPARAGK